MRCVSCNYQMQPADLTLGRGMRTLPRLARVLQIVQKAADLQDAISEGATSFLITEYKYMGVFMVRIRW